MRDDLRRHLNRTRNTQNMLVDAPLQYAMDVASAVMDVVEAALRDEQIPAYVIREVLDKITYGVVPSPADIEHRRQLMAKLTDAEADRVRSQFVMQAPGETVKGDT